MSLVDYLRKRWEDLSPTAKDTVNSSREYYSYCVMMWERDYYKGEVERLEKLLKENVNK